MVKEIVNPKLDKLCNISTNPSYMDEKKKKKQPIIYFMCEERGHNDTKFSKKGEIKKMKQLESGRRNLEAQVKGKLKGKREGNP